MPIRKRMISRQRDGHVQSERDQHRDDERRDRNQQIEAEPRGHGEDQRGDAERREQHREVDDRGDHRIERLEQSIIGLAFPGMQRQRGAEHQAEEDHAEHVGSAAA